jgi:hypothetical protein
MSSVSIPDLSKLLVPLLSYSFPELGLGTHAVIPALRRLEAGGLRVQGQPGLHTWQDLGAEKQANKQDTTNNKNRLSWKYPKFWVTFWLLQ